MKPNSIKDKEAIRTELFNTAPEGLFEIEREIAFLIEEQRFEKGLSPKEYGLEWDKIEGRATKRLRKIIQDKRGRIGKEKFRQVAIQTLIQKQNLPSFKAFREQVRVRLSGGTEDQAGNQQRKSTYSDPNRLGKLSPLSPSSDDIRYSPTYRGRRRSSIVEDLRSELRELALLWFESERANSGKVDWPKLFGKASVSLQAILREKRKSTHFEQCPLELLVPVKDRRAFELFKSRLEQGMVSPRHVRAGGELPFLSSATENTLPQKRQRPISGRLPSREPPAWRRLTIGSRVGIYWTDDNRYYKATVLDRYGGSSNMSVRYDDDVVEKLDMAKEKIRILEGRDAEKDDPSDYQDVESDEGEEDEAQGEFIPVDAVKVVESEMKDEGIEDAVDERHKNRRAGVVAAAKAASVWKSPPRKENGGQPKPGHLDPKSVRESVGKFEFAQDSNCQENPMEKSEKGDKRETKNLLMSEVANKSTEKETTKNDATRRPNASMDSSKLTAGEFASSTINRNDKKPQSPSKQRQKQISMQSSPSRIQPPVSLRYDDTNGKRELAAPVVKPNVIEIMGASEGKGEAATSNRSKGDEGENTRLVAEVLTAMGSLTKDGRDRKEGLPGDHQDRPDATSTRALDAPRIPDTVASRETSAPTKKRTRKRKSHEDQYLSPVLGELAALLARGTDENQRPDWKFIQRNASKALKQYMNKKDGVSALVPNEVFDRFVHEVAEERNIWLIDELGRDPVTGEMLTPAPPPPPPPPPPPVPQPAPQFQFGFPLAAMYANARAALANGHVPIHPMPTVAPPVMQGEQFHKRNPVDDYDRKRKRRFADFMNSVRQDLIDYQKDESMLMESLLRGYR